MRKHAYKIRLFISGIVLLLSILAICGVYLLKVLDVQFTPLLERSISTLSYTAIALLIVVILSTVAFGRFYCSIICPCGILQEFSALILRHKKKNTKNNNYPYKYFICALVFGALVANSTVLIRYIDPYSIFGSALSLSIYGLIFTAFILALVFFKNRFFCTNICPVGTLLGICAKNAINTMNINSDKCVSCKMCERNCPSGCIDIDNKNIDNEMCVKCLKCYSVCPKEAIYYGKKQYKFSFSRRKAIVAIGVGALFTTGYLAGIKFTKELAKKVKNIILPPGAKNANKMVNRCLNCNLCIENCPNKILNKADETFSAVHIDYTKGEKYCKFDCHKCADVCPTGAIERMNLEEKQNTRIAMAVVQEKECQKCASCIKACPKSAITIEKGETAKIDASKCIGCAKCTLSCPFNAIKVFAIKEQNKSV